MGTKKILSIDGGGTRGLFPATILNCIHKDTGKLPTQFFDLIVGTATGGIITSALAADVRPSEIANIYHDRASEILPINFWRKIRTLFNIIGSKYPNTNLKQIIGETIGTERTLKDVKNDFKYGPVFLFATLDLHPELEEGEIPQFKPVVYSSENPEHENELLLDVAMRSASAAINLPIYGRFTEGGNYANDPSMIGLSYCLNPNGMNTPLNDIRLLSLGCGSTGNSVVPKKSLENGNWGLAKWFPYLINLVIDTGMVAVQHYLNEILGDDRYLRVNAYYSADDAPDALRNKKLKIDVRDPEQLKAIKEYAESVFEQKKDEIYDFLEIK